MAYPVRTPMARRSFSTLMYDFSSSISATQSFNMYRRRPEEGARIGAPPPPAYATDYNVFLTCRRYRTQQVSYRPEPTLSYSKERIQKVVVWEMQFLN